MSFLFRRENSAKQPVNKSPRPRQAQQTAVRKKPASPVVPTRNEDDIFNDIEKEFFESPSDQFDPVDQVLSNLPDDSVQAANILQSVITKRQEQLNVVSARLHQNVISNYNEFVKGMIQIRELGVDLETTVQLCRDGRSVLRKADRELISAPAKIISSNRKKLLYQQVVGHLLRIKKAQNTEQELKLCLEEGDFVRAIEGFKTFKEEIADLRQFHCLTGIVNDADSYDQFIQDKLDSALLEITRNFHEMTYERILNAYKLAGKEHRIAKRLQQYFANAVSTTTYDLLYAHILMSEEHALRAETLRKLPFASLCKKLSDEVFVPCVLRIFEILVDLMHSHYRMRECHLRMEEQEGEEGQTFVEVRDSLQRFSKTLWDQMQNEAIIHLLKHTSLPTFKIESFLEILDAVNKLIDIGEEFSGSSADNLRSVINQQSRTYFSNFHKKRVENMKTMVENERWEAMPVPDDFSALDIREIRHFIQLTDPQIEQSKEGHVGALGKDILNRNAHSVLRSDVSALASVSVNGNPFSLAALKKSAHKNGDEHKAGGGADDDDDDEDEELKQEFIQEEGVAEEIKKKLRSKLPAHERINERQSQTSVTIACASVVRYIGNYLQMMKVLKAISFEIFQGVTQLYEYYLFVVAYFFCHKPGQAAPVASSSSLKDLFHRAHITTPSLISAATAAATGVSNVLDGDHNDPHNSASFLDVISDPVLKAELNRIQSQFFAGPDKYPLLSSGIDIQSSNTMYGLHHRTVAVESLDFLANTMNAVKSNIVKLLPRNHVETVHNFYAHSVEIVPSVHNEIMSSVADKMIHVSDVAQQIERVKTWSQTELGTEHNPYVNTLANEFKMLSIKLEQVVAQSFVSEQVRQFLTERCITLAMDQLIEGYSRVKKCTAEGRTQMSLDLQVFVTELKKSSKLRTIPQAAHVDNYIKAYYSDNLAEWIKQNVDKYTGKQLLGLAQCVSNQMNRKDAKDLMKAVEEILQKKI